jgi:hypothetical protein
MKSPFTIAEINVTLHGCVGLQNRDTLQGGENFLFRWQNIKQ